MQGVYGLCACVTQSVCVEVTGHLLGVDSLPLLWVVGVQLRLPTLHDKYFFFILLLLFSKKFIYLFYILATVSPPF